MTELRIATANDFGASEVIQLPSQKGTDLGVRVQKPDPFELMLASEDGNIPDILTNIVVNALNGSTTTTETDMSDPENIKGIYSLVNIITQASFVEPKVVPNDKWEPNSGTVPISDIKIEDRIWLLSWALGVGFNSLENFRSEQDSSDDAVDDVPESNTVSGEPQPVVGD